jgi:hypothetical protein
MELEGTTLGKIKELVDGAVEDYLKAHQGNKTAGKRARAALMDVKNLAHAARKELVDIRKGE